MSTANQSYLPVRLSDGESSSSPLCQEEKADRDEAGGWEQDNDDLQPMPGRASWLWRSVEVTVCIVLAVCCFFGGAVFEKGSHRRSKDCPPSIGANERQQRSSKLHLLLPLTPNAHSQYTCKTIMSAIVHGYEPIILNWDSKVTELRATQKLKITGVLNFLTHNLTNAQQDDLVLMVDATDVWIQQSPWIAYERFYELLPEADKVLVGVDSFCWPNNQTSAVCTNVPESPLPPRTDGLSNPRWVNSGSVMGSVGAQRLVFEKLQGLMETTRAEAEQAYFNVLHHRGDLLLDYSYRLFHPTTAAGVEPIFIPVPRPLDGINDTNVPFHMDPTMFSQSHTGEFPVLLHLANAHQKVQRDTLWGRFWWSSREPRFRDIVSARLAKGKVRFAHDAEMVQSFLEFCPNSLFDLENWH